MLILLCPQHLPSARWSKALSVSLWNSEQVGECISVKFSVACYSAVVAGSGNMMSLSVFAFVSNLDPLPHLSVEILSGLALAVLFIIVFLGLKAVSGR